MINRKKTLEKLILLSDSISNIKKRLSKFSWNNDKELIKITPTNIVGVLQYFIDNNFESEEIEEWANIIECREDIGFIDNNLQEYIFYLANPTLYGEITKKQIELYIVEIKNRYDIQ
ncbi:hypothetical protein O8C83_04710 [Aliarcobacter butzleri]|uniref:hypothetical protein n=1 Tax=Aliarcobacter butzleri TaxID=28197 RepID=UPI00263DBE53|nr:hypothetical protein [Aliarcobacter butzleri]MDN5100112.1 hypothetical protein [Aliarcobacter butzleri]